MLASELVVDLRHKNLTDLTAFWDAINDPCGLPEGFGRNLDAWWDTIETRNISSVIDSAQVLVVRARLAGMFAPADPGAVGLIKTFTDSSHARLELEAGTGSGVSRG